MKTETSQLLNLMEKAVLEAAAHLIRARENRSSIQVTTKPDHSIVMNLDIECQERIFGVLGKEMPVVSEEDESTHALIGSDGDYFIVDPIDGTASCKRYLGNAGGQIGFGPLVGLSAGGKLAAAVYFNLPTLTLYSAGMEEGAFAFSPAVPGGNDRPARPARRKLGLPAARSMSESALLFFPGTEAELKIVHQFRDRGLIENTYRFGGFASDCMRIAEDYEQVQLQQRVKAWDFSAVAVPAALGLDVTVDPLGARVPLGEWRVAGSNPVLVSHPERTAWILERFGEILK